MSKFGGFQPTTPLIDKLFLKFLFWFFTTSVKQQQLFIVFCFDRKKNNLEERIHKKLSL